MNALNRRKNTRIKYPHCGAVGELPRVYFQGEEMNIGNISTGGLLIIDDREKLGHAVGAEIKLQIVWPDLRLETKARLVSAQLQRRHIQFSDFSPTGFIRVAQLIKPGFLGSHFHKVNDQNSVLDAEELWIGPTGESLLFPKGSAPAQFTSMDRVLLIDRHSRPYWRNNNEPVDKTELSDLLIMLSNLPAHSTRVKELIEILQRHYEVLHSARTGTGG
jgi:hypothetical protein